MKKEPIKLEDLKRKPPLSDPPVHYFDELPMRVRDRISKPEKLSLWQQTRPVLQWAAAPAVALVLIILLWPGQVSNEPGSIDEMLAGISDEELVAWLDETEGLQGMGFELDVPYGEIEGLDEDFDLDSDFLEGQEYLEDLDDEGIDAELEQYLDGWESWDESLDS